MREERAEMVLVMAGFILALVCVGCPLAAYSMGRSLCMVTP